CLCVRRRLRLGRSLASRFKVGSGSTWLPSRLRRPHEGPGCRSRFSRTWCARAWSTAFTGRGEGRKSHPKGEKTQAGGFGHRARRNGEDDRMVVDSRDQAELVHDGSIGISIGIGKDDLSISAAPASGAIAVEATRSRLKTTRCRVIGRILPEKRGLP